MAVILGTAGHIDHGKSSLVKALTRVDPDRLPEEKKRGLSIELGFCPLALPQQENESEAPIVSIIDVPGHERFIRTMVAGVYAIDLVLFVIAADAGPMPQSKEHREICQVLGIRHGILVLNKADLLPAGSGNSNRDSWTKLHEKLDSFVQHSFLESAPRIAVSSKTGEGIERLRQIIFEKIIECRKKSPPEKNSGPFRMWIDRSFILKGLGNIVTGTTLTGGITPNATVTILPSGKSCRIRQIQMHGKNVHAVERGNRTALNVTGLDTKDLPRGALLASPQRIHCGRRFLAWVEFFQNPEIQPKKHLQLSVLLGTTHVPAKVRILPPCPGDLPKRNPSWYPALALVQLVRDLPFCRHDRLILRNTEPRTVGGGLLILDVNPITTNGFLPQPKFPNPSYLGTLSESLSEYLKSQENNSMALAQSAEKKALAAFFQCRGHQGLHCNDFLPWLDPLCQDEEGQRYFSQNDSVLTLDEENQFYLHQKHFNDYKEWIVSQVAMAQEKNPLSPGIPQAELLSRLQSLCRGPFGKNVPVLLEKLFALLIQTNVLRRNQNFFCLPDQMPQLDGTQKEMAEKILKRLRSAGLSPPNSQELFQEFPLDQKGFSSLLQYLIQIGLIVKINPEIFLEKEALQNLKKQLVLYLKKHQQVDVKDFKELSGVSRKYAIPFLEFFDKERLTLRVGNSRRLRDIG